MSERIMPGPVCDNSGVREAVCIHTKKIYDSCRDRDCVEDLRFYPTHSSQSVLDRALSVRAGKAELLNVEIDVESTGYNKGFYTVDIRYFYKITADAYVGATRPIEIVGLAIFDKRTILFGGEGGAKIFSSEFASEEMDEQMASRSNRPTAVVESVDPIVLGMKLVDPSDCMNPCCPPMPCPPMPCPPSPPNCGGDGFPPPPPHHHPHMVEGECCDVPPHICSCFGSDLCFGNDRKRLYITLGQFSIVRLERDTQLLVPVYDYCLPKKECAGSCSNGNDDPCELFRQVQFPVDDFFPPNGSCAPVEDLLGGCRCK